MAALPGLTNHREDHRGRLPEGEKALRRFNVVTQSATDLELFGRVGKVIYSNSAFRFFLQADDIEKAKKDGVLDYGEFEAALLKSVRRNRPKYWEIFLDTPFGTGVARLVVDDFSGTSIPLLPTTTSSSRRSWRRKGWATGKRSR